MELHRSFASHMISCRVFMQTNADLIRSYLVGEVVVSATEAVSNLTVKSGGVPCLQCGMVWHVSPMLWLGTATFPSRGRSGDRVEGAPLL